MNKGQNGVLITVAILIAVMMLYPPFYYGSELSYYWIFGSTSGRVEVGLLLTQFVTIGIVGAIIYVLCADKKE